MKRFMEVTDGLFRGSAPSIEEVRMLHEKFHIKKIVSLDKSSGERINRVCKLLGIEHIIIPIDMTHLAPIFQLLNYNLKDLLIKGGPTFVHCMEGKDRTGMVVAMYQCKYMGWSYEKAISAAKKIGFGLGLDPKITKFYEKVVKLSYENKDDHAKSEHIDTNSADIVENNREEEGITIDNADMKSFAPYQGFGKEYDYAYDQFPTRNNHDLVQEFDYQPGNNNFPQIGLYDNDSGIKGVGPVDNGGGFVST